MMILFYHRRLIYRVPEKVYELVAEFIKLARSQLLKKVTFNSCYTPFILSRASSFFFFFPYQVQVRS